MRPLPTPPFYTDTPSALPEPSAVVPMPLIAAQLQANGDAEEEGTETSSTSHRQCLLHRIEGA